MFKAALIKVFILTHPIIDFYDGVRFKVMCRRVRTLSNLAERREAMESTKI
jgi:hypothetical protein